MGVQAVEDAVARLLGGKEGREHGVVGWRAGDHACTVVLDVDFEEDQGLVTGLAVARLPGELGEQGHLGRVVDHDGDGVGAQGGGDGGQSGNNGWVNRERVEDVDVAAFRLEFLEEGGDLLGFKNG